MAFPSVILAAGQNSVENDPSVTMHLLRSFVSVATKRNHGVYLCRSEGGNEAGE
jgi:hypothetical protein